MAAIIIAMALVALVLYGTAYYIIIPFYYNIKVTMPTSLYASECTGECVTFAETIYAVVGASPLLIFGLVALASWINTQRSNNYDDGADF